MDVLKRHLNEQRIVDDSYASALNTYSNIGQSGRGGTCLVFHELLDKMTTLPARVKVFFGRSMEEHHRRYHLHHHHHHHCYHHYCCQQPKHLKTQIQIHH